MTAPTSNRLPRRGSNRARKAGDDPAWDTRAVERTATADTRGKAIAAEHHARSRAAAKPLTPQQASILATRLPRWRVTRYDGVRRSGSGMVSVRPNGLVVKPSTGAGKLDTKALLEVLEMRWAGAAVHLHTSWDDARAVAEAAPDAVRVWYHPEHGPAIVMRDINLPKHRTH